MNGGGNLLKIVFANVNDHVEGIVEDTGAAPCIVSGRSIAETSR
jgi:hypothetical protein